MNIALPKMKEQTLDVIKSTYLLLDPNKKKNNFELFGLDFMLDEEFKPWLI
jgi:tubulin monoglycylase TTLL3/8